MTLTSNCKCVWRRSTTPPTERTIDAWESEQRTWKESCCVLSMRRHSFLRKKCYMTHFYKSSICCKYSDIWTFIAPSQTVHADNRHRWWGEKCERCKCSLRPLLATPRKSISYRLMSSSYEILWCSPRFARFCLPFVGANKNLTTICHRCNHRRESCQMSCDC